MTMIWRAESFTEFYSISIPSFCFWRTRSMSLRSESEICCFSMCSFIWWLSLAWISSFLCLIWLFTFLIRSSLWSMPVAGSWMLLMSYSWDLMSSSWLSRITWALPCSNSSYSNLPNTEVNLFFIYWLELWAFFKPILISSSHAFLTFCIFSVTSFNYVFAFLTALRIFNVRSLSSVTELI